ncbi:NAD(P)-dependent oxidoreductase [Alkalicoccobacillus porphyridii]|uniref:NAD(P)-dependent oxidoreductase n=1 Tax=Alkalicoccobacillus porphyridii TaxID=2597270 RepID=A0A554A476_9BACI|nr:NAD(P)-dependent oxidoreductase [Alkalicoccobacillus porphyridii]TSB48476.1 NAD(P)-dependent oxidoreductase [Alkalicoccobacillus porphyridii]
MQPTRISVVGTGFIARGLIQALRIAPDLEVNRVLTRRDKQSVYGIPYEQLTQSLEELLENTDILIECSGDVQHGTEIIMRAFEYDIPVITMNAELQVTTGSYLATKGFLTEAEGDQPGSLAALKENAVGMGFKPVVYGNIKGFLNLNPTEEEMRYWSERNGLSLEMVTSFTDGTKVQVEQALVANGLGADILYQGLNGQEAAKLEDGAYNLAELSLKYGHAISDYLLCPSGPPGVFITATHHEEQAAALEYFKLGKGPFYTLIQPFHLCHLEILKTIRRVERGDGILLNNSTQPRISVAAIAKNPLQAGELISKGIGSFQVRGEAVKIENEPNHIPIGLLQQARVIRPIEEGEILTFNDVEIDGSTALKAWLDVKERVDLGQVN